MGARMIEIVREVVRESARAIVREGCVESIAKARSRHAPASMATVFEDEDRSGLDH